MKTVTGFRLIFTALLVPLLIAGCFSSAPQRSGGEGSGSPSPRSGNPSQSDLPSTPTNNPSTSPSTKPSMPSPSTTNTPGASGPTASGSEPASDRGRSREGTEDGGTRGSEDGETQGSEQARPPSAGDGSQVGGQDESQDRVQEGQDNIRVASVERPGTESGQASDRGLRDDSPVPTGDVSSAEALKAANAAVEAAADAVDEAESTIERAREAMSEDGESGGGEETYDPWAKPAAASETSASADSGGAATNSSDAQASGGPQRQSEESFDPFADYSESDQSSERPSQQQISESSLQIADNALSTANSALNRARRALIEAAAAGNDDADAEAVQLAAARAALEAAAEAVVASAIAVLAAAASIEPTGEPVTTDPAEIQRAMEEFAAGLAMVVGVLHKEMTSAADALNATAELLTAAGSLISMVGQQELQRDAQPGEHDNGDDRVSAEERVASLEAELDESLGEFDDRMIAEGSAMDPALGEGEEVLSGAPIGAPVGPDRPEAASTSGSSRQMKTEGRWAGDDFEREVPDDLETVELEDAAAQDDDIVARQLREAAAAETDPELREKLWEEYYAYKESLERGEAESTK